MPESLIDLAGLEVGAEDFLAAVLRTATQPIWVVDPEDVIRFANPAALATLGYDRADQLLGRHSHATIHHSHPDGTPYPAEECPMLLARVTGETVSRDLDWFFRRDGSPFPVSYVSAPIELEDGRGAVVAFTDIEERLRAERALRRRDERLAAQQESLLRVAEVVAGGAASGEVFAAIAREVGQVIALPMVAVWRYDPEGTATVIGEWSDRPHPFRVGTCWPLDGPTITAKVLASGRPARIEDFGDLPGTIASAARDTGIGSCAGAPIIVDGRVWGAMSADTFDAGPLAEGIEDQLAEFTALVATAISNSLSREALIRLADEQAALRRLATLVAEGASPGVVLDAAVAEMQALLDAYQVALNRFEPNEEILVLAHRGLDLDRSPVGARVSVKGHSATAEVRRTGRPARVEDYELAEGDLAMHARDTGVRSSVSVPITLEGRVWGLITASWKDEQPPPPETEERMSKFAELLDTAIAGAEARAQRERLADEQAALRRVATLVAHQSPPAEVFGAVAEEAAGVLDTEAIGMLRFEPDGTATLVAQSQTPWDPPPLGTRFTLEGENVIASVFRSRQATRVDDWTGSTGMVAGMAHTLGIRSAVATPIVVEGRLWGTMVAVTSHSEPLPAETESRLGEFTELVATAIANTESHARAERLTQEQAALRRVATLVAHEAPQAEVFRGIAEAIGQLLGTDEIRMIRYEGDRSAVVVGSSGTQDAFKLGSRHDMERDSAASRVLKTGRTARIDDYGTVSGSLGETAGSIGLRSAAGAPILVEGRLWGAIVTGATGSEPLPPETEVRLGQFTELMATAIANAEARAEVERLAEEQAALRRVATLAAEGASPGAVLDAVAAEMEELLHADQVALNRFEPGDEIVVLAHRGLDVERTPVGTRVSTEGESVTATVRRTGRPARMEGYESARGALAEIARDTGLRSSVSAPITVEGRPWGLITASWKSEGSPPPDTEERMAKFAALLDTAIANTEARTEIERLAEEQAALRRVATLVAEGAPSTAVFDAVAAEMANVLGAHGVTLSRYEPGDEVTVVAHHGSDRRRVPVGTRVSHRGENVTTVVRRTERPARMEHREGMRGSLVKLARTAGVRASVGAPIVVEGRLWGVATANWRGDESPPPDTEKRMAEFAGVLDTAIANAASRDQLAASRERLVTAADEARRRLVRDLHDGAQQRLVHTIVTLKLAQRAFGQGAGNPEALVGEALQHAERGNAELRELAHGILPAVLTRGGLRAGVDAVVSRLELPVRVDVPGKRFPSELEASAYFIVAEALTNVIKHSQATRAEVRVTVDNGMVRVEVQDDGIGGADPEGHGLVGMADRVTALGGRLTVESPPGDGTLVAATLPLSSR